MRHWHFFGGSRGNWNPKAMFYRHDQKPCRYSLIPIFFIFQCAVSDLPFLLVEDNGFEPLTPAVQVQCSGQTELIPQVEGRLTLDCFLRFRNFKSFCGSDGNWTHDLLHAKQAHWPTRATPPFLFSSLAGGIRTHGRHLLCARIRFQVGHLKPSRSPLVFCWKGRIRTAVLLREQIYSLSVLTTHPPSNL